MSKASFFASFQKVLAPGFGGNLASVLAKFTNPDKWEGIDITRGLQHQLSEHASLVNSQLMAAIIRLNYPKHIEG